MVEREYQLDTQSANVEYVPCPPTCSIRSLRCSHQTVLTSTMICEILVDDCGHRILMRIYLPHVCLGETMHKCMQAFVRAMQAIRASQGFV